MWWNRLFRLDVVAVKGTADEQGWTKDQGGQKTELQRGDRTRFPYEPRVIGGMMPAELQRIHRIILDAAEVEIISDEMRAVVESLWPGLAHKVPISTASESSSQPASAPGSIGPPRLDGLHWNGRSAHLRDHGGPDVCSGSDRLPAAVR